MVCMAGFEPATYALSGRCSTAELHARKLEHRVGIEPTLLTKRICSPPHSQSATGALNFIYLLYQHSGRMSTVILAESEGFEPSEPVSQFAFLAGRWFQPLTQLSVFLFIFRQMPVQEHSRRVLATNPLSFLYPCTNQQLRS